MKFYLILGFLIAALVGCTTTSPKVGQRSTASTCDEITANTAAQRVAGFQTGTRNFQGFAIKRLENVKSNLWYASADYLPIPNDPKLNNVRVLFALSGDCQNVLLQKRMGPNDDVSYEVMDLY